MIAASAPFAVFGAVPVTARTINDILTVGRTVISCMERASIIDRDQLDKISKKIHRAITPGFQNIDINKLLESATGSAIVQPIQLLQDLYIKLNNSLAEMESNEIFHIIDWDATGNITSSTNMITHHVADLMAQRVIDNTTQMIQRVQASGAISADAILRTVLNDMIFMTYKILNSIEDPRSSC
jgi:Ca2+-binding EF-hand superfamily protein